MTSTAPKNWQKVKEIFYAATQRVPNERVAFLDSACGKDADLRDEVERMLASSEAAGSFMRRPAVSEVAALIEENGKLRAGQSFSHYKILDLIGKGGMGEVYLAEDTRLDRKVALKILPSAFKLDEERMRRFLREAKAASALNHPNILTIYENGETDGTNFIASEFVDGESLSDRVRHGSLSLETVLDIAVQVAGALATAHEAGIVHRDIKPDNLMVRPDGVVKLLDFGIAKLSQSAPGTDTGTAAEMIIGTANYMSPEQARRKAVDARSDIFSFGLVLYEMLAGKKAFEAEYSIDAISGILQNEPVPLSHLLPGLPPEIESIVDKALRKDREERYQTANELLIDLKDCRQELKFRNKLGRSALYQHGSNTDILGSPVSHAAQPQTSSAEYIITRIAQRKRGLAIGLIVLLLVSIGVGYWYLPNRVPAIKPIESIAVLPFVNDTGNPDTEFLSDGIAQTLISSLSQLQFLNVKARSSVFAYKGRNIADAQIAKELNVQAIVNGHVTQRDNDLSLYIELVDVLTDKVVWSQTYDRQLSNLPSLQSEIARDVAKNLKARISGADEQRLSKRQTDNAEAYQLYLKGEYAQNKHSRESLQSAIQFFNQALEKDPNYALAYCGLSKAYGVMGNNYLSPNETFPKAREFVERALELDDSLAEAHAVMASINLYYDWDISGALKEVDRALDLDPNNASAHNLKGSYFEVLGHFDEALIERKSSVNIEPLSAMGNFLLGTTYYLKGDLDMSIDQQRQTIKLEPGFSPSYLFLGQTFERKGMYAEAVKAYTSGLFRAPNDPKLTALLAHAYAASGNRSQANVTIAKLREIERKSNISAYYFAVIYAGMNDKVQMFDWLEKAYRERPADMIWLRVEPMFSPFHDDPRFQDLLKRMGV